MLHHSGQGGEDLRLVRQRYGRAHCYYIPADSSDNLINDTGSRLMLHQSGQRGESAGSEAALW